MGELLSILLQIFISHGYFLEAFNTDQVILFQKELYHNLNNTLAASNALLKEFQRLQNKHTSVVLQQLIGNPSVIFRIN